MKAYIHRYKKIIFPLFFTSFLLVLYFLVFNPYLSRQKHLKQLPPLPIFSDTAGGLENYILNSHNHAVNNPLSDKAVGELAMAYHANYFYNEAEICYSLASKINLKNYLWPYYLGLIKEELGDSENTIKYMETVVKLNPLCSQAWLRLGNSFIKVNSFRDAEHALHKATSLQVITPKHSLNHGPPNHGAFPLKAYAYLSIGRCALLQGKIDSARIILEELISSHVTFGPAYRILTQVYLSIGDSSKSKQFVIRASDFDSYIPPADPLYDNLVIRSRDFNFIIKQIDIAINSHNNLWAEYLLQKLLEYFPENSESAIKQIIFLLDMHRYEEAAPLIQNLFEMNHNNHGILFEIAIHLLSRNQRKEALVFLGRVIQLNPGSIPAHVEYVKTLTYFKKYEFATEHCLRVIANKPNNADIRNEYGRLLYLQERNEEAKQQLKMALNLKPNNDVAFLRLGSISQREDDSSNAIMYYRKSIAANPTNINPWLRLGNYFIQLRWWNEALIHFQNALVVSPNNIDFLERYAWILATCPDEGIRDGQLALAYAKRLSMIRKRRSEQDVTCGIIFAVAYAELGQFEKAIAVTSRLIDRAKKIRYERSIPQLEQFLQLFSIHEPYRL